jgi:hypothetical protein
LLLALPAAPQEVTGTALKAAFLYNFAKFIEWPPEVFPDKGPFVVCVHGDGVLADALEQTVKGRRYADRTFAVARVGPGAPLGGCHILYIASGAPAAAAALLKNLRDQPTLTVSDLEDFTGLGGITQLYLERGRMRLFIDIDSANRARLKVSSRLLELSKRP